MHSSFSSRQTLKSRFRARERIFAGWVSYSHPSITETLHMLGLIVFLLIWNIQPLI